MLELLSLFRVNIEVIFLYILIDCSRHEDTRVSSICYCYKRSHSGCFWSRPVVYRCLRIFQIEQLGRLCHCCCSCFVIAVFKLFAIRWFVTQLRFIQGTLQKNMEKLVATSFTRAKHDYCNNDDALRKEQNLQVLSKDFKSNHLKHP